MQRHTLARSAWGGLRFRFRIRFLLIGVFTALVLCFVILATLTSFAGFSGFGGFTAVTIVLAFGGAIVVLAFGSTATTLTIGVFAIALIITVTDFITKFAVGPFLRAECDALQVVVV